MSKTVINAKGNKLGFNLKELVHYKDLFLTLAIKDFKVRYAQTYLGLLWGIIQPLVTLLILIVVFGQVAKIDTGNVPYPLFALSGITAWSFFSYVINNAGTSVVNAQAMIKKVYFPRIIIPLSKAIVGFMDFFISFIFLVALMIYYHFEIQSTLIFLPVFIILNALAALSIGIWISALTVRYRDFQVIVPFMVQIGLYITPVAYPAKFIPEKYQLWYYLNPMAGIVEGMRWSILGVNPPNQYAYFSFVLVFFLFISALLFFNKIERKMADII